MVGLLNPPSKEGHKYILAIVDYSTSFPEAIPMKNISSIDVAEAFMTTFARICIPKEILSDNGPKFTSDLIYQVHPLVGIKSLFTTPYHQACNGKSERQIYTEKIMQVMLRVPVLYEYTICIYVVVDCLLAAILTYFNPFYYGYYSRAQCKVREF